MIKSFKIKSFKYGFISGIVLCLIIQWLSYSSMVSENKRLIELSSSGLHIDIISHWGIPFPIIYGEHFMLAGLIANILIALILSFLFGLTFNFIWSKLFSNRFR